MTYNGVYAIFYVFFFLLIFFMKAFVVGTFELHRQVDKSGAHNIVLHKEVDKKYTGCNMKTTELLDCVLIVVCAVNRLNTVCCATL